MRSPRYFLPEHPTLTDVFSKAELRAMLQAGQLSRSDMVTDDETGIAYLLGDLLAVPFPDAAVLPARSTTPLQSSLPPSHEFRANTPLPQPEHESGMEDEDDELEEGEGDEEDEEEDAAFEQEEQPSEDSLEEEADEEVAEVSAHRDSPRQGSLALEDDDLDEEEELLYLGHPSWLAFPKSLFIMALCVGSAVFFYQHNIRFEWITLLGSIAGLILLFIGLDRTTTTYFVTSKRVEMEFGIIGRNTKEVRIADIRAIDVTQRGFDAVVGLGTVKFDSSASAGPEVTFKNVRRPHRLKQLVRELQG